MKVARFTFIAALTLVAGVLASGVLIAQERSGAEANGKRRHYRVTDLGTFGGTFSDALGINDKGWVAGFAAFADGTFHAFLWREGLKTDLGTLGGPNSTPSIFMVNSSVNQKGEIVGAAATSTVDPLGEDFCIFGDGLTCLPFLWQDGGMTPLSTLGGMHLLGSDARARRCSALPSWRPNHLPGTARRRSDRGHMESKEIRAGHHYWSESHFRDLAAEVIRLCSPQTSKEVPLRRKYEVQDRGEFYFDEFNRCAGDSSSPVRAGTAS